MERLNCIPEWKLFMTGQDTLHFIFHHTLMLVDYGVWLVRVAVGQKFTRSTIDGEQ